YPLERLVLLVKECRRDATRYRLVFAQREAGLISEPEQPVIVFAEAVDAGGEIVLPVHDPERRLETDVCRRAMIGGDQRIARAAIVLGAIIVKQRRNRQQRPSTQRAHPRKIQERVDLLIRVANACRLLLRSARYLKMVLAQRCRQTELIAPGHIVGQRGES